jgi:hypothetical protein
MLAYNMLACEMQAYKMHAYDRSYLLELLTLSDIYLRVIYIYERSIPTHIRVSHRRVFQSLHLRGIQLIGGRVSQGMRISWACASHKRVSHGRVSFAGMHLKGLYLIPCTADTSYSP